MQLAIAASGGPAGGLRRSSTFAIVAVMPVAHRHIPAACPGKRAVAGALIGECEPRHGTRHVPPPAVARPPARASGRASRSSAPVSERDRAEA